MKGVETSKMVRWASKRVSDPYMYDDFDREYTCSKERINIFMQCIMGLLPKE